MLFNLRKITKISKFYNMKYIKYEKITMIFIIVICLNAMAFTSLNIKDNIVNNYELSVIKTKLDKVDVSWLLLKSKKIDFMYLQKSVNKGSFKNILKVKFQGQQRYRIEDNIEDNTTVFYRIMVVDKHGEFTVTPLVKYPLD